MVLRAVFFDMDDTLVLTSEADRKACIQVGVLAERLHPELDKAALIRDWHHRFVEAPWDTEMKRASLDLLVMGANPSIWPVGEDRFGHSNPKYACTGLPAPRHGIGEVPVPEWRAGHWDAALQDQGIQAPSSASQLQQLFDTARIELFRFEPGVKEMVAKLKEAGVQCIIITNGHANIQRTKLVACQAAHLFDGILVGGEEVDAGRFEKPHPSIFLAACRLANCQAVHIGDNLKTDVEGANRAGLQASVWVNRGSNPLPEGLEIDCLPTHIVEHVTDAGPILTEMMS